MRLPMEEAKWLDGSQPSATTTIGQQTTGSLARNTSAAVHTALSGGEPFAQQRHDLLWMSLGIYIGLCVLSAIVKRFNKLSEVKLETETAAKLTQITRDLTDARANIATITSEKKTATDILVDREGAIQTKDARLRELEQTATLLRQEVVDKESTIQTKDARIREMEETTTRLRQEADAEKSTVAEQNFAIARLVRFGQESDKTIRDLRNDLRSKSSQLDQDRERFAFLQQQAAESDQLIIELRLELSGRPTKEQVLHLRGRVAKLTTDLDREADNSLKMKEANKQACQELENRHTGEKSRLTRMLAELERTIRDIRRELAERVRERDTAREQLVFVQQQYLEDSVQREAKDE